VTLKTQIDNLATRVGSENKSLRTLINGNLADLSGLNTAAKNNLVAAINELVAAIGSASLINDAAAGPTTTYSSSKIVAEIAAAVAALVATAPATLDTLNELASALGGDANFAATTATALGLRVRVDAAQSLSGAQQNQARANIGAVAAADVGDTNANFVAVFEAALA
jgi:hypothetical protein